MPTPEEVVEAHRQDRTLPGGLGLGGPETVEFALVHRAQGRAHEALEAAPDSPRGRLERYLLFTYPEPAPLETIQAALARNPNVALVERNLLFEFAVSPNDPLFDDNLGDMTLHQWGSLALNLPAAWDFAKGHAFVGLIDTGVEVDHPDLAPFDSLGQYVGGNLRTHLSFDFQDDDTCVDELNDCTGSNPPADGAGHGTHVSGIVAATADNGAGVAGACQDCSILMTRGVASKAFTQSAADAANGLVWHFDHGAQSVSMSFGRSDGNCDPVASGFSFFCDALFIAEDRDLLMTASPGNDKTDIEFPASDARVLSIGGIEPGGAFWDRADESNPQNPMESGCPCTWPSLPSDFDDECSAVSTFECGSNYTVTPGSAPQDLVAPAKLVLSTFYRDKKWSQALGCWDDPAHAGSGYDVCTGTSMSSPYAAAIAGILRSVNPLLSKAEIRDALTSNASLGHLATPDPKLGFGIPDAAASVQDVLGRVGGAVIDNRLTPLFQLYGFEAEDHVYTTSPQFGSALTRGESYRPASGSADYRPTGPDVAGYDYFPGGNCLFFPCPAAASVYVFTTDRSPDGHPLVPLYRLSFQGDFGGNPDDRDHTYTTEAAGIQAFTDVGYQLDGVEGYIYERCTPEPSCIPTGAVRLYRLYHSDRDDWAIFPESELAQWQADGYTSQPGTNDWIGYVYENVDSDADWLIDGFEGLIGTDPATADSDCDGAHDGQELFKDYPYGDPLDGTCSSIVGEGGQVDDLRHVAQTVILSRSYTDPVVIAQPASYNGAHQSVVRITDVQSDRFTFRIEEAPNLDGGHTFETVSYLVLEAGSWQLPDGTEIEVGEVSTSATVGRNLAGSFATVSFSQAFPTAPLILTQIQTANDPSWAKTRQLLASTSSFKVALEEEEASTTAHGTETIGWVAVSPGTGVWSGHRFEAASTANAVTDAFFSIGFSQSFRPDVRFLAAQATRDGADNSAVRYTSLSATGVSVKIEEDTSFDTEVSHTTEVVSYLVLQNDGTLAASPR